ncbi:MAG: hypothetical protein ACRC01_01035 [Deefgea sp.]
MNTQRHLALLFSLFAAHALSASSNIEVQTWQDGAKAAHTLRMMITVAEAFPA